MSSKFTTHLVLLFLAVSIPATILKAQRPQMPAFPGTTGSGNKPRTSVQGDAQAQSEAQLNEIRLIGMAAAMKNMVLTALKDAVYIVRQEYYCLDDQNNKILSPGKSFFGRRYGLAIAADGRLWTMNNVISPWLEDEGYNQLSGRKTPVRSFSGLRRLDADRSFSPVPLVAYAQDNRYIGYYEHPSPLRFAQAVENTRKTEGRLIMFYVNNGEDPELAEVQSTLFNVDPDWSAKGVLRNPLPSFEDKLLLGGVYVVEEAVQMETGQTTAKQSGRKNSRNEKANPDNSRQDRVGVIQFKIAGLYHQQGAEQFILAIPSEPLQKAEDPTDKKGRNRNTQSSSGRSGRR